MRRTADHIHDELLVLRCQAGDADSFTELVDRWRGRLLRHVHRLTDGHDDTADLLQEIWMTVARKLRRLDDPACFPVWLYRIATARCADWVRKRSRDRTMKSVVESESVGVTDDQSDKLEAGESVRQGFNRLPSDQRIILSMFYIDDLTTVEIAVALAIPVGTVKSRLYHARKHLRDIIERSES